MNLALVNLSKDPGITAALLDAITGACAVQFTNDYAPHYQAAAIPIFVLSAGASQPPNTSLVQLVDDTPTGDALAYHDVDAYGRPVEKILWQVIKANGGTLTQGSNSLSVCISHENLETAQNPYVNCWHDLYAATQQARELCDPVEGDSYEINGIAMSNFVRPRYFSSGEGPYDHLGKISKPFTMDRGGYSIIKDANGVRDIYGASIPDGGMPQWKRDMKRANVHGRFAKLMRAA